METIKAQILTETARIEERLTQSPNTLYLGVYLTEGHNPSNGYKGSECLPKVEIYQRQSLIWGEDITAAFCSKLTSSELVHVLSQLKEI